MPYIPKEDRRSLVRSTVGQEPKRAGDLTFCIYHETLRFLGPTPRFADFALALGAIEAAKMELYRRLVAPYEDGKIAENGDVTI